MFALSGKLTTPITAPPPTNQGPNAIDDLASTPFNTPVIIVVLNNDTDPNVGDVLGITTVTNGLNGTTATDGKTITYTPNAAFTTGGVDTFQYAVSDPGGLTDTATVRVTVGAIPPGNRAPIATNDVFMLLPDVIFPDPQMLVTAPGVLENDVDPDGNVLTVELLTGPAANPSAPGYPTFALSPDGSFLYNHGVGIAAGASPTPVTFTYRVSDGLLVSNVATATVNVTRPVGQPIANNDAMTTQMNTAITFDVDANDTNGTAGVTTNTGLLQPTLTIQRPPVNGLALVVRPVATGVDRRVTYTPNPGFVGVDTFTYTIMDNQNFTSNVATVTVTVNTPVAVPNVIGAAQAAASVTITGAGLTVGTITQVASATVASGNVISSNPAAGTLVAPGSPVALVLSMGVLVGADPTQVLMVFSQGTGNRTAAVTTVTAGVTLVAFVGADGPAGPDGQAATVSGGGLTWTRVVQQSARSGVAEIWTATAPGLLTAAGITSTLSTAGFLQQITVIGFTNVSAVGASYGASTPGTAAVTASIGLVTQGTGSLVYGVGLDWATVSARTVGAGQTKLREYVPLPFIASWVQRLNGVAGAAGSSVTLTTTAPTSNAWNMAAIELMR